MTRPVIRRYASVFCKLMSVLSRRHGSQDILEKDVNRFLPFLWSVKVVVECIDSSCRR